MVSDSGYDTSGGNVSPEGIVVMHYMKQIDKIPETYLGEGGFNKEKFTLHVLFLIAHLPDENSRRTAKKRWDDVATLLNKEDFNQWEVAATAGMEVISDIMQFIYSAFELIHIDVDGPATSKQFRDSMIEIPDVDRSFIHPKSDTSEEK
jgi:hypothetical protein